MNRREKRRENHFFVKHKKSIKVEQYQTPPHVHIMEELATPIKVINKEFFLDQDTTCYIKGCTKGKDVAKQILSCSFGNKP